MLLPVHRVLLADPVDSPARRRCPPYFLPLLWLLLGTSRSGGAISPYPHASCTRAPSPSSATSFSVPHLVGVGPWRPRRSRPEPPRGGVTVGLEQQREHQLRNRSQNSPCRGATGSSSAPYVVEWPPRSASHSSIARSAYLSFYVYPAPTLGPGSCGAAAVPVAHIKV